MDDNNEPIDPIRIEPMKKLSMHRFDQVETRPGASQKEKMAKFAEKIWMRNRHIGETHDMKISKFHRRLLTIESLATKTNFALLMIAGTLFCIYVLPFLMYSFYVMDTQFLGGWIYEPVSLFAKTTTERHYYIRENIPFHTIDDLKEESEKYLHGLKMGKHGTYYEQFWSRTKSQIIDGAKNYAYSFLPTPVDPAL